MQRQVQPYWYKSLLQELFNKRRAERRDKSKDREYELRVRESEKKIPESKYCPSCHETKHKSEYNLASHRKNGLSVYCKECSRSKKRKYNVENKDKRKKYDSLYRLRNPLHASATQAKRRTRITKFGGAHTTDQVTALKLYYCPNGICIKCGLKKKIVIDHVIPVSRGGTSHIYNLQPLCSACNREKHAGIVDYRFDSGSFAVELHGGQYRAIK